MKITIRNYEREKDYKRISQFLVDIYRPKTYNTWLQQRWEYMHYQPMLNEEDLNKIGIFEREGKICGVVTYESDLGEAHFLVHPDYKSLKPKLYQYAEDNLGLRLDTGKHRITVYIKEGDRKLEKLVNRKRYQKDKEDIFPEYIFSFPQEQSIPKVTLPDGVKLITLTEATDTEQLNELLKEQLSLDELNYKQMMIDAPHFDKDLNVVAVTPEGDYASYCGVWYEPNTKTAYIKPVCTKEDYQNKALAKACVMECVKKVRDLGAKEIFANAKDFFYESIGFKLQCQMNAWRKDY